MTFAILYFTYLRQIHITRYVQGLLSSTRSRFRIAIWNQSFVTNLCGNIIHYLTWISDRTRSFLISRYYYQDILITPITFVIVLFATHISICSWTASFEYCGWCIRIQAEILSTFGRCFWYRILWMASKSQDCHVAVVSSLVIFVLLLLIYTFKYHFLPIHWSVARSFFKSTISFI